MLDSSCYWYIFGFTRRITNYNFVTGSGAEDVRSDEDDTDIELEEEEKEEEEEEEVGQPIFVEKKEEEVVLEIEEDKYSFERDSFSSSSESTLDEKKDIRKRKV